MYTMAYGAFVTAKSVGARISSKGDQYLIANNMLKLPSWYMHVLENREERKDWIVSVDWNVENWYKYIDPNEATLIKEIRKQITN